MTVTSAAANWWKPAYHGGRLEVLDDTECHRLMVVGTVGRLGYSAGDQQRIIPMNYVLDHGHLVFRTSEDSEVARHVVDRPVAFEVDEIDPFLQAGWSVLVTGPAEILPREELRAMDVGETPEPWASGVRPLYLRLSLTNISGRRVHPV